MTDESNTEPEVQTLQDMLPEDLREVGALKDFKTPADLAKSYVATKEKIGSMVSIPTEDADVDTKSKFYNRIGRPETTDGYDFEPQSVEGLEGVTAVNKDNVKLFKEKAHEMGLTKAQAKAMMDHVQAGFTAQLHEAAKGMAEAADSASKELRKDWGVNYDKNLGQVDAALSQFFTESDAKMIKQASAQNPSLMKSLATIGSSISETPTAREGTVNTSAPTKEDAKEKIKSIQADRDHPYWNKQHPNHKQAAQDMNKLYEQAYDNV